MLIINERDYKKVMKELSKCSYKCPNCGKTVVITDKVEKAICRECGRFVFKNKKDEFNYRLKEQMKKQKSIDN